MAFVPPVRLPTHHRRRGFPYAQRQQATPVTNNGQLTGTTSTVSVSTQAAYLLSGVAHLTAPKAQVYASAIDSPNTAALIAPRATALGYGGATATLSAKAGTLSAAGTVTALGVATLTAPTFSLGITGTNRAWGSAALTFGSVLGAYKVIGYSGAVCSVTIGGATLTATGTLGATGGVRAKLPLYSLAASGTVNALSYANLLCPKPTMGVYGVAWLLSPRARLIAVGSATVAVTYEAYSVNLRHAPRDGDVTDEVTHYTNFPFDRIVRLGTSYFGVAADGLYLLEGTVDDNGSGTPADIRWSFHTGDTDFGSPFLKTIRSVYFGGKLGSERVTINASNTSTNSYNYPTPNTGTKNFRQLAGRGIKARYFSAGADGTGDLDVGSIDFDVQVMTRKI